MFLNLKLAVVLLCVGVLSTARISAEENTNGKSEPIQKDLATSATSAKLFNLGSLFGQNPGYGYGNGYGYGYGNNYYPNTYRPSTYYPYKTNYYPTNTYPSSYYPSNNYNPSNSGWSGSNYPNYANSGGYYPSTGGYGYNYGSSGTGYYPSTGTNILGGNGGYGGYGGNGGLPQYYGYWNPEYSGQRNRGYGYYANTDRYGLPRYDGGYNDRPYDGRGGYGTYRGYD